MARPRSGCSPTSGTRSSSSRDGSSSSPSGWRGGPTARSLLLTPILAETIAKGGWSRGDVKRWLFDNARLPASKFEAYLGEYTNLVPGRRTLAEMVEAGKAPPVFAESDDPQRMVPLVCEPDDILIAVTGDPLRTNAYVFAHNGMLGYPVGKRVTLPGDWEARLRAARSR